jgi:hypothetical protein
MFPYVNIRNRVTRSYPPGEVNHANGSFGMWYRRNVDDLAAFNFAELKLVKET